MFGMQSGFNWNVNAHAIWFHGGELKTGPRNTLHKKEMTKGY